MRLKHPRCTGWWLQIQTIEVLQISSCGGYGLETRKLPVSSLVAKERLKCISVGRMRNILLIIVLLLVSSCGIRKHIQMSQETESCSSAQQVDSSVLSRYMMEVAERIATAGFESISDKNLILERTIYSEPDCAGAQYVKEVVTATLQERVEEKSVHRDSTASSVKEVIDSSRVRYSERVQENTAVTAVDERRGLAWWQTALIWVGIVSIVILAVKIIWKLR